MEYLTRLANAVGYESERVVGKAFKGPGLLSEIIN
jgi:hypothetical protein